MERMHNTKESFLKDPAVKEFTKAVRKFSKKIPFTNLTINHEVETKYTDCRDTNGITILRLPVTVNDYFSLSISQGYKMNYFTLSDVDLPEYPPIHLSQCEYDMLVTNDQKEGKTFGDFKTYLNMQAAGWFKGVPHDMLIDDVIAECIVKGEVDEEVY